MTEFAFSPPIAYLPPSEFFEKIKTWLQPLSLNNQIPVELSANRLGIDGHLPDNPSIIELDQWFQAAQVNNCPITSIHLPLRLDLQNEDLGREISSVNGWTDLAAYAGISYSRMHLLVPDKSDIPIQWDALKIIMDYLDDMDVHTALHSPVSFRPTLLEMIQNQKNEERQKAGYDLCIPFEALNRLQDHDMINTHILSVRFSETPSKDTIELTYQNVNQNYSSISLLLFDLRKCQMP